MADRRPLDTAELGPIRIGAETPEQRAVGAVMRERGCYGDAPCTVDCTCRRIVRLVAEALNGPA